MRDQTDPNPSAPWARHQSAVLIDGEPVETGDGYRVVAVNTPSSGEVRDLASYRRDLELARVYAEELARYAVREFPNGRDPRLAFWLAAIVCYGRAFNTGARTARLEIDTLDAESLKSHRYFLDLRNKHVAHAVNDFEHTIAVAYLTDSAFAPPAVSRTGQAHVEYFLGEEGDTKILIRLCNHFIRAINRRLRVLHQEIGRELAQMGREAVYALPDLRVTPPQRDQVTRRRK